MLREKADRSVEENYDSAQAKELDSLKFEVSWEKRAQFMKLAKNISDEHQDKTLVDLLDSEASNFDINKHLLDTYQAVIVEVESWLVKRSSMDTYTTSLERSDLFENHFKYRFNKIAEKEWLHIILDEDTFVKWCYIHDWKVKNPDTYYWDKIVYSSMKIHNLMTAWNKKSQYSRFPFKWIISESRYMTNLLTAYHVENSVLAHLVDVPTDIKINFMVKMLKWNLLPPRFLLIFAEMVEESLGSEGKAWSLSGGKFSKKKIFTHISEHLQASGRMFGEQYKDMLQYLLDWEVCEERDEMLYNNYQSWRNKTNEIAEDVVRMLYNKHLKDM